MKGIPRVFFIGLILTLGIVAPVFSSTKAGTTIESAAEIRYGTTVYFTEVSTVEVAQMFGLTLTPTDSAGTITPEGTYYFPHRVENVGNGSDLATFTLSNITPEGWSAQLIVDENFNQIHEPTENTTVPAQVPIAEDAIYDFFLALTASTEGTGIWWRPRIRLLYRRWRYPGSTSTAMIQAETFISHGKGERRMSTM
jgi:hypothetical protein